MKKSIIIGLLISIIFFTKAQNNSDVLLDLQNSKTVVLPNGMKILFVQTTKYDHLFYRLQFDIPLFKEHPQTGSLSILIQLMGCDRIATEKVVKDMVSSTNAVDSLLRFMSNVVIKPKFSEELLQKIIQNKKEYLSKTNLKPETKLKTVSKSLCFGIEHTYAEEISDESLNQITLETLDLYHETYFMPNNATLAVVGNFSFDSLQSLVIKHFGSWQRRKLPLSTSFQTPKDQTNLVCIDNNDVNESYISLVYPLDFKSDTKSQPINDLIKKLVSNQTKGYFQKKMVDQHKLTQYIDVQYIPDFYTSSFQIYSSTSIDETYNFITTLNTEMLNLKNNNIESNLFQSLVNELKEEFTKNLLKPVTIAEFAINTDKYKLSKTYYQQYLFELDKITTKQIQKSLNKIILPEKATYVVIAPKSRIFCQAIQIAKIMDVRFRDYDLFTSKIYPKGFGAEYIINQFLIKTGASDKIKNITINYTGTYETSDTIWLLSGTILKHKPNYYFTKTTVKHNFDTTLMHHLQIFNGQIGLDSTIYGKRILEGNELTQLKYKAWIYPEKYYKQAGYEMELICNPALEEQGLYMITLKNAEGEEFIETYEIETGYKIKLEKIRYVNDNQIVEQTFEYSDYRAPNKEPGNIFPHQIIQTIEGFTLILKIVSVSASKNIKKSIFQIQ